MYRQYSLNWRESSIPCSKVYIVHLMVAVKMILITYSNDITLSLLYNKHLYYTNSFLQTCVWKEILYEFCITKFKCTFHFLSPFLLSCQNIKIFYGQIIWEINLGKQCILQIGTLLFFECRCCCNYKQIPLKTLPHGNFLSL